MEKTIFHQRENILFFFLKKEEKEKNGPWYDKGLLGTKLAKYGFTSSFFFLKTAKESLQLRDDEWTMNDDEWTMNEHLYV